jgi:hypothetical protein
MLVANVKRTQALVFVRLWNKQTLWTRTGPTKGARSRLERVVLVLFKRAVAGCYT